MGFFTLIAADKLAATYDPTKKILILLANCRISPGTRNITFCRDPHFVGGLKFNLEGWTGPIVTPKEESYEYEQKVSIVLPSPVMSGDEVIIATANYPKGQPVTVRWLGLKNPSQGSASKSPSAGGNRDVCMVAGEKITTLYKMPFNIMSAVEASKYGAVDVKFDPKFLTMTNAGNEDGNIVWTFNSLQTGMTQVIVTTVLPPPAILTIQKTYDVEIVVLETSDIPKSLGAGESEANKPGEILSFIGRVTIAMSIVLKAYPDSKLLEVECALPHGDPSPTHNPLDLSQLKAVFQAGKGTVIIMSTGWGTWGKPMFIDQPWLEDVVIPWPIKMDIVTAAQLMQKAGYIEPFWNCTLRHPLGPPGKPFDEPYYIFKMVNGPYVFVGVNDGAIYVNNAGQAILPK